MHEEVKKEIAASGEGNEPPKGFNIYNFIIHLIDRLETRTKERFNKLEAKMDKLEARIEKLSEKINNVLRWSIGILAAVIVGFAGVIVTLLLK